MHKDGDAYLEVDRQLRKTNSKLQMAFESDIDDYYMQVWNLIE